MQLDENVVVARVDPEIFHKRGLLRRKVEGVDKKMFLKKYVVDLYVRKIIDNLRHVPSLFLYICLFILFLVCCDCFLEGFFGILISYFYF